MEFEMLLNMNDTKVREIVEKYRHIRTVYEKIKAVSDQHPRRRPVNETTSAFTISAFHFTSSTTNVRF